MKDFSIFSSTVFFTCSDSISEDEEKGKVMKEARKKKTREETSIGDSISALGAFTVYLITGLFLAVGFWVVVTIYSVDLISDPSLTLRLLWVLKFYFFPWFLYVLVCIFQLI